MYLHLAVHPCMPVSLSASLSLALSPSLSMCISICVYARVVIYRYTSRSTCLCLSVSRSLSLSLQSTPRARPAGLLVDVRHPVTFGLFRDQQLRLHLPQLRPARIAVPLVEAIVRGNDNLSNRIVPPTNTNVDAATSAASPDNAIARVEHILNNHTDEMRIRTCDATTSSPSRHLDGEKANSETTNAQGWGPFRDKMLPPPTLRQFVRTLPLS